MKLTRKSITFASMIVCFALAVAPNSSAQKNADPKALEYLASHEPILRGTNESLGRLYLLIHMAPAAVAANENGKAISYAEELILLGPATRSTPGFGESNYANANHVGSIVLGRVGLMNGEVKKAKDCLLAAGRVPGSPTLNSFGPDMLLAKELIEKGERNTVIEYFDLCAKFWANDRGRLQQWKNVVTQGGTPDFGASLRYVFDSWRFAK